MTDDARRYSPACERNRDPILEELRRILPTSGVVLEIASGTGMHAVYFARHLHGIQWQPTDVSPDALRSVEAWRASEGVPALRPPRVLDVTGDWPIDRADAVFNANMIHIAPWEVVPGLFAGAARILSEGAPLVLYGPFFEDEVEPAPSNLRFDASLRSREPRWGIRRLEDITDEAAQHGLTLEERVEMPANNLLVVFRRS